MMRKYTNKPAQGPRGRGLMRMDPNQESGQSSSSGDHKTCSIHIFMEEGSKLNGTDVEL